MFTCRRPGISVRKTLVINIASHTRFRAYQKPETLLWVFSRGVDFVKWFPVAFLTNGAFIVTQAGFELATPAI